MFFYCLIKEEACLLNGREYKQITYEDGEVILKRFDEKYKMWVILKFNQNDDTEQLEHIRETTKNYLLNTLPGSSSGILSAVFH